MARTVIEHNGRTYRFSEPQVRALLTADADTGRLHKGVRPNTARSLVRLNLADDMSSGVKLTPGTNGAMALAAVLREADGAQRGEGGEGEGRRYLVWNEGGDLLGEFDSVGDAQAAGVREGEACAEVCGTDGQEESPGRGDFRCGVMSPHGIHIQVTEDGQDITGHYDALY